MGLKPVSCWHCFEPTLQSSTMIYTIHGFTAGVFTNWKQDGYVREWGMLQNSLFHGNMIRNTWVSGGVIFQTNPYRTPRALLVKFILPHRPGWHGECPCLSGKCREKSEKKSRVCVCPCTYMCIYIYTHTYIYTYIYTVSYVYVYIYIYIYIRI